ncbi:patatin-like phospholipase family protein [Chryseobacterium paridis]|uniref:Patatin-like phospholipase family protein n=1 Tax=Chryseobacterium paridis TaxID=2800328 RepID=A0ABS1G085_9FLAO|nr:patatin-like phospholipase family protein [Chryseobacterium paridis]MBK1898055.1 patatin-like phospholipase family protein [Chryseobacterium paridis]
MKNFLTLFLLSIFSLYSAQDSIKTATPITKDTKFGLALSGGGAKGFAHLGILKTIDSLGIKIDYITGTSMGGILGGLYAMGYNGEQLKKMVYGMNWKRILSNKIPYNQVNISEKDEYNKYILEFPVINGKPSLPSSYIEGQYMGEVLNTLTFPAKHVNDFSKLQIPVQLTSSDIVNGGLVMQKKGSLALAIRSTLAIPAAFAPVYIDGKLLVDGGLDRNFPVKEVKDMGADYIIGGYTGFRLFTKEEIKNPMKMIYQTHAFHSVQDFNEQKKMSDILVDFVTPLNDYTTKDFRKYREIIKIGEAEAKKHLPEFIALANEQRKLGIIYDHKLIEEEKKPTIRFTYSEDNGTPINNPAEIEAIRSLMGLKEGVYYDAKTINAAIDRVFGVRQYDRVYYTYTDSEQGLIMNIFVKRAAPGNLKLALHYDNEQSVGIILNYTYRDYAEAKFRALATVDISERFKARLQFQKFLDTDYRWWISMEGNISFLKSNDLLLRFSGDNDIENNLFFPNYIYRNIKANTAINYSLHPNTMASFGLEFNAEKLNRSVDKISQTFTDLYSKKVYYHTNLDLYFKFNQNSFNTRYYPTSGNNLQFITKYYFGDQYDLYNLQEIQPQLYDYLNPGTEGYYKPKNLISLTLNENYIVPINKRISVKANAFLGTNFAPQTLGSSEGIPYLFLNQKFNLGGSEYNFDGMNPEFNGFRQKEVPMNSIAKLGLEVQYRIYHRIYLTPSFHYASISDELSPFKSNEKLIGYGLNLGYESILGPININVSRNDALSIWRAYFSIGFKF